MSTEDEVELKDLIMQTLEAHGCLPQIKAQLRSSLYLSLHEDVKINNLRPLINKKVQDFLESTDGRLMFNIVREFLEFCSLDFTLSVFETESYMGQNFESRSKLVDDLGLNEDNTSIPILLEMIQSFRKNNFKTPVVEKTISEASMITENNCSSVDNSLSAAKDKIVHEALNSTFVVSNVYTNEKRNDTYENLLENTVNKHDNDVVSYEDPCSLVEDSHKSINNIVNLDESDTDNSLKNSDKSKSQKSEKVKAKSAFSCLPDLSSLQHKSRVSDILPSLYNKELKDKSNLQELDKIFDMEDDYEEDFICSGQDFSESYLTSDVSKNADVENDLIKTDSQILHTEDIHNSERSSDKVETIQKKQIIEET